MFGAGFSEAATLNVPSPSYPTIQSAIDAAAPTGDTVLVADGTYTGAGNKNLNFRGKVLTVKSAGGAGRCIIDCQGSGRGFGFYTDEGNTSVVQGFTIKNGDADYGGGIDIYYASPTIKHCVFQDCFADFDGGGIACFEQLSSTVKAKIDNCLFINNTTGAASGGGGGINCDGASPEIQNCTFVDCSTAGDGGGIYIYYTARPTIYNSIFANCDRHAIHEDHTGSDPAGMSYCFFYNNADGDYYDFDTSQVYTGAVQVNTGPQPDNNTGNKDGNPYFKVGPFGGFYLSQKAAGQLALPTPTGDSNCVNAGTGTATGRGLSTFTTRTDGSSVSGTDSGTVDIGYHYDPCTVRTDITLTMTVVGGIGTIAANPAGPSYKQYSEVQVTATPDPNYKVGEWDGNAVNDINDTVTKVVTMTTNKTVTVRFVPRAQFMLTTIVVGGVGGTLTPTTGLRNEGEITLVATPEPGWKVKQWTGTVNDSSLSNNNTVLLDGPKTVTVEFETSLVRLDTAVIGGNGRLRPRSGYYPIGTEVALTATPDCGYRVKQWTGTNNDSLKTRENSVTMNSDRSVSVEFEVAPIHTLTTTVQGGPGTIMLSSSECYPDERPGSGSFWWGTVVTLRAVLEQGWQVKQWMGTNNDSLMTLTNTVTINSDKHVTLVVEKGPGTVELWRPGWTAPYRTYPPTTLPNPLYKAILDAAGGRPGTPDEGLPEGAVEWDPCEGDIVLVSDGVYILTAPLDFTDKNKTTWARYNDEVGGPIIGKHITVRSKNGPENCIIDCKGVTSAFLFQANEDGNTVVEGFTIRNGTGYYGLGGGIYCYGAAAPVIRNCIIENCSASSGGGAYIEGLPEEDTKFEDAAAAADANVAILAYWMEYYCADPNFVDDCEDYTLRWQKALTEAFMLGELAAAVRDTGRPGPVLDGCKIINNTTTLDWGEFGGGIYITNASPVIKNTEITGNKGWWGGGIYSELDTSAPAIINCLITENESSDIGGAIYLRGSGATINLCTIAYNTGLDYGDVDPENNNRPYGPKGGIVGREADAAITNCIIWGNGDDLYEVTATYSCIEDLVDSTDDEGEGNIGINPMFARGPLGNFYLSRADSGNGINSPCVNAGQQYALYDLSQDPPDGYNIDFFATTSIKNLPDSGFTDMGYHYPRSTGPAIRYNLCIDIDGPGTTIPAPGVYSYIPGTVVTIEAFPAEGYWAYWSGSDNDESFSLTNTVTMYTDRCVEVTFKPIRERVLYVPSQYPRLQDAIDAAEYKDTIVLEASGADNPYRTQQGFVVASKRALTITSENPDDPAVVAATVIEMTPAASETGGDVESGFTFADVGPDTVLQGITIRGFNWHAYDGEDADDPLEPGENGDNTWGGAINCGGPVRMGIAEVFPRVYMGDASPTIRNCIIEDCNISGGNGGTGAGGTEEHPNGIEGGWPGGAYGGGMSCIWNSSPTVINCTFNNCRVTGGNGGDGGSAYSEGGYGGRGGGWTYPQSSVAWYGVPWTWAYQGYWTYNRGVPGGGPPFYDFYTVYTGRGGAVFVGEGCSPTFTNCTFTNNRSTGGFVGRCGPDAPAPGRQEPSLPWRIDNFGGAVYCDTDSSAIFENCLFMNNFADTNRPVRDPNAPISEDNYDNDDEFVGFGGAVAFKYGADVRFASCLFGQNRSDIGGAAYWADSDPIIAGSGFWDNSAQSGGAILLVGGAGKIVRSIFSDNDANSTYGRGGAICALGSDAVVADCQIMGNEAYASGGGVFISSRYVDGSNLVIDGENIFGLTTPSVLNSLIAENTAGRDGGGISVNWLSEPNIINCTITDNVVSRLGDFGHGGGLYTSYDSNSTVINSIIWGNIAPNGNQIAIATADNPSVLRVSYSDVQGGGAYVQNLPGTPATGGQTWLDAGCTLIWDAATNLHGTEGSPASEPAFVTGFYGNFYLSQTDTDDANQTIDSPCVDAGEGTADALPFGRYRYTTRTDDGDDINEIDMGYHPDKAGTFAPGDLNYDGVVDDIDLYGVLAGHWLEHCSFPGWCEGADLNWDGTVNFIDFVILEGLYGEGDTMPPEPNPSAWLLAPVSGGATSITMRAAQSADNSGLPVYYYFECTTNGSFSSTWQTSSLYTATSLATDVEYGFRVRVADHKLMVDPNYLNDPDYLSNPDAYLSDPGNLIDLDNLDPNVLTLGEVVTDWSYIGYAIPGEVGPPPDDTTAPSPNPVTWATPPEANSSTSVRMTATTATDDSGVEYYFDEVSGMPGGNDSTWQDSPAYTDAGLVTNTTYSYRVKARDKSINRNETLWSNTVAATPTSVEPPPTLEAPDVNNAFQVKIGFDWYVSVVAEADAAALYYRFVCTDSDELSSEWVPQTGTGTILSGMGTVTYGDGVTYRVAVGPARMTWHFQVCGSNSPTGSGEVLCSGVVTIP